MNTRRIDARCMQGRDCPQCLEATQETCKSLLGSSWFYYGAIASLCIWSAIWMVLP